MKLSKFVQTIYIPKHKVQKPHTVHGMGDVYVTTWKPMALGRPPKWKKEWDDNCYVWVEYQAVRTFKVKHSKKSLRLPRKRGRVSK